MDKNAEVLARIIAEMTGGMENSRKAQAIAEKISQGKATYADALDYAQESGRVMNGSLRKNLPDALTDGKLYREAADQVVRKPMESSGKQVAEVAAEIQQYLNEEVGIGIRAIVPEVNEDQITGIITDICNAESYDAGKDRLFTQIENFLEGTVDDCVRENADFQYKAGLSPKIERRTVGKCCEWCSRLAGTYEYDDVSDRGNDVFRRHKNCHCIVSYNPGDGSKRRQNVHTGRWTNEGRDDRIIFAESSIQSGGYSGAKKTQKEKDDHASRYYEEVRNRKPYADARIIAKRIDGFTEDDIEEIRQHMFVRKVRRDSGFKRFDPDYDQAQVWQRMTTGQPLWDSDKLMLEHERMESRIMKETGCTYEQAHDKTQEVFDWWSEHVAEEERRSK